MLATGGKGYWWFVEVVFRRISQPRRQGLAFECRVPSRLFLQTAKDKRRAQRNSATFSKADRSGAMLGAWGMIDPLIILMVAVPVFTLLLTPRELWNRGVC